MRVWTSCTAIAPSPPAAAQRLIEPARTSPAAKIPGSFAGVRRRVGAPCVGESVAAGELEHPHRCLRRARADDLETDAVEPFQYLAPPHERGQHQ
jgi:hypothetical protein